MKKKILVLGLIGMLATMMTSCLVVFPDDYEYEYGYSTGYATSSSSTKYSSYGDVVVYNQISDGYISEISYGTNNGNYSEWYWAWNDGHKYEYRAAEPEYYYGSCNGNTYTCKMPAGYTDIRVTVVYPQYNGTYQYEDFIFDDQYISKNNTLYLTVKKSTPYCK